MLRPLGALLLLCLAPAVRGGDEEIHVCPDGKGGVVYQGDPCAPLPVAAPKPTAPRRSPPKAPAPAPTSVLPSLRPVVERGVAARPASDPALATPEKAWTTYVGAIRAGDRNRAIACLTPEGAARIEGVPMETLRASLEEVVAVRPDVERGSLRALRVERRGRRSTWILLERTASGNWKIASL